MIKILRESGHFYFDEMIMHATRPSGLNAGSSEVTGFVTSDGDNLDAGVWPQNRTRHCHSKMETDVCIRQKFFKPT